MPLSTKLKNLGMNAKITSSQQGKLAVFHLIKNGQAWEKA